MESSWLCLRAAGSVTALRFTQGETLYTLTQHSAAVKFSYPNEAIIKMKFLLQRRKYFAAKSIH